MKRGLIKWDKTELPPEAFEARLAVARKALAERDLPALVVYTDIWKSNRARYFSNFMPYWNRALLVIPREGAPILLCGLSPRVYPWIKSVTILEEIRPSQNLSQSLLTMCTEKSWSKVGVLDAKGLPYDLYAQLGGSIEDVPWSAVRKPGLDEWELAMYQRSAALARSVLDEEMPRGSGKIDHEFVGELERRLRRAGAEDVIVLVTNGKTPPAPPTGTVLTEGFSATVACEYCGHWVRLSRSHGTPEEGTARQWEDLSGPYPYESTQPGPIFALHTESQSNGRRLFQGDSCFRREKEILPL